MSDELDRHQLRPLLERVTQGDRQALNDLFTRLRPYLHALVRRTLGPDWKDASDVVQSGLRRMTDFDASRLNSGAMMLSIKRIVIRIL
jgi:DNA-directed RNA polymerase specialized sigma24 family protein